MQAGRPANAQCGEVLQATPAGIEVAAQDAVVTLTQVQRAGGKRLAVADFLRGVALQPGTVLGAGA